MLCVNMREYPLRKDPGALKLLKRKGQAFCPKGFSAGHFLVLVLQSKEGFKIKYICGI